MKTMSLVERIAERAAQLPTKDQQRILEFADALARTQPRGVPGETWRQFAGAISKEDLELMEKAIEEECERIDPDGW